MTNTTTQGRHHHKAVLAAHSRSSLQCLDAMDPITCVLKSLMCRSVLQCVATGISMRWTQTSVSMLQCVAVCCSVLQCVAAWCSAVQSVAADCNRCLNAFDSNRRVLNLI